METSPVVQPETNYDRISLNIPLAAEVAAPQADVSPIHAMNAVDHAEKLAAMRVQRRPGFHQSDKAAELDVAVVDLLLDETSDDALIRSLITPDDREVTTLSLTLLGSRTPSHDQLDRFNDRLGRIHQEKVAAFESGMRERGIDPSDPDDRALLNNMKEFARDPETALDVPKDFWDSYRSLPGDLTANFLISKMPLPRAATALKAVVRHGLQDCASEAMGTMAALDEASQESYAASLRKALDSLESPDSYRTVEELCAFDDPMEIVRLARATGNEKNLDALRTIFVGRGYSDVVHIPPGTTDVLIAALPHLSKEAWVPHDLAMVQQSLGKDGNPTERATEILAALSEFSADTPKGMLDVVLRQDHPVEAAQVIKQYGEQWKALPRELHLAATFKLSYTKDLALLMTRTFEAVELCEKYNLPVGENGINLIKDIDSKNLDVERHIVGVAAEYHFKGAVEQQLQEDFTAFHAGERLGDITINEHPALKQLFSQLGIPTEMAEHAFEAWYRYSTEEQVLHAARINRGLEKDDELAIEDLTLDELKVGVSNKAQTLSERFKEMDAYVAKYGAEEAAEIHQIFGTVNFGRMTLDQQHRQLERWRSGEPPRTLAFVTDREKVNAYTKAGEEMFAVFGEEGTFVFEADGKRTITRKIRQVGSRERAQGREPIDNPTIEKVIIAGHGSSSTIDVGKDILSVEDYVIAERWHQRNRRARPNHYRADLGNAYETILDACLTAAPNPDGENIAESIAKGHHTRTHGATTTTHRINTVDKHGNVIYSVTSGMLPATVYEGKGR